MKIEDDGKIRRVTMDCGGNTGCCPTLANDGEFVEIKDDFGGKIRVPSRDGKALLAALTEVLA